MKDNIKKIILEWQEGLGVTIYQRNLALIYTEEINTVIGLRRSGKTYFIFSEIEKLLKNGLQSTEFMYINFDDERLAELKGSDLNLIILFTAFFLQIPSTVYHQKKLHC